MAARSKIIYPPWICGDCGKLHGKHPSNLGSTWHLPNSGESCGWCGSTSNVVTEPRDFGYPDPPKLPYRRL